MDPCPFVRLLVGNLALSLPEEETKCHSHASFYCQFKVRGLPSQVSDIKLVAEADAVENRIHGCFSLSKAEVEKLVEKSSNSSALKIDVRRWTSEGSRGCGLRRGKLIGCVVVKLDLKNVLENWGSNNKATVVQNGWVVAGGSAVKLHMNVRAESDPRFVFRFDGEPECSPQVFQVNGNVKQPVFSCKFGFRNSGEWGLRSRSSASEASTSSVVSCFRSPTFEEQKPLKERKGWSITIHDLSGSPVAAASILTPFVPSEGSDCVTKSNPGSWLILRPGQGTWKPWAKLEAWRERRGIGRSSLGYRFDLIPDGGLDTISLTNCTIDAKAGGKFSVDITTGPSSITSPSGSFDLGSSSGSGSSSDLGSWANILYRGFIMSCTIAGDGKCSKPEVEVGVQHVSCTEDAAAFVALAAAVDLSVDACGPFSRNLRKELRQEVAE